MYKINEIVEIPIDRDEANFDRACDSAYRVACATFGLDDDGYCKHVKYSKRSTDSIIVEFKTYKHDASLTGHNHIYIFNIWVERCKND